LYHCSKYGALVEDATTCNNGGHAQQSEKPTASSSICERELYRLKIARKPELTPSSNLLYVPIRSEQSNELSQRLEQALKRVELLSYAVIGLSVIILIETLYWTGFIG
jgi:hypothetical protein